MQGRYLRLTTGAVDETAPLSSPGDKLCMRLILSSKNSTAKNQITTSLATTRRLVETGMAAVPDYLVGFDYATG
jgi:hypothetical protein